MRDPVRLEDLERCAPQVPFFALVKYLQRRLAAASAEGNPRAETEAIRFAHDVRPIFHASDVVALRIDRRDERATATLTTGFLGLVGAVSPLPSYFTEEILRAELADDTTLRDFYDVLHHRLIGLHFRGMLRAEAPAEVRVGGGDRTTTRSIAAAGLALELAAPSRVAPRDWLAAARILGRRPRTRSALEETLAIALPHLTFRLEDFLPGLASRRLSNLPRVGTGELRLRRGVRIGRHVRHHASGVRLLLGPVGGEQFRALLPGGRDFETLVGVVRATLAGRSDAELEVEILAGQEPRARMGARFGSRLRGGALVLHPSRRSGGVRARVALTGTAVGKATFLVAGPAEARP